MNDYRPLTRKEQLEWLIKFLENRKQQNEEELISARKEYDLLTNQSVYRIYGSGLKGWEHLANKNTEEETINYVNSINQEEYSKTLVVKHNKTLNSDSVYLLKHLDKKDGLRRVKK